MTYANEKADTLWGNGQLIEAGLEYATRYLAEYEPGTVVNGEAFLRDDVDVTFVIVPVFSATSGWNGTFEIWFDGTGVYGEL